ncbi:MAG: hypothetical protein GEU83_21010 [Pseudonocardiaceae bacterium]|nr:hypothetical protein [Pseudonocardiaceae bacterium]
MRAAKKLRPDWWDPTGARHGGLPTYWWRGAPDGLMTRRQLRAAGLRPGGQDIAAQVVWRRRRRVQVAYLYRVDLAKPKRLVTTAQLIALDRAIAARRTCPTCRVVRGYCIPLSLGECVGCAYPDATEHDAAPDSLLERQAA